MTTAALSGRVDPGPAMQPRLSLALGFSGAHGLTDEMRVLLGPLGLQRRLHSLHLGGGNTAAPGERPPLRLFDGLRQHCGGCAACLFRTWCWNCRT